MTQDVLEPMVSAKENRTPSSKQRPILVVNHLIKHFTVKGGFFQKGAGKVLAVDGVSFELAEGETRTVAVEWN